MTIQLYNQTGDPRQLQKNITHLATITAQLTDQCSVTDPVFIFDMDDDYITANYIYVSEWDRYYYITDRVILNGNQVQINCHVDVLMSFRNDILNSQCIADRCVNRVNPYIEDSVCGDAGTIETVYRRASTTPFGYSGDNYVLMIAGR